jgi:hypothetical protein
VVKMADVKITFTSGKEYTQYNCGYSVYKGMLYIWDPGKRKGKKPRAKYSLKKVKTWKVL